MHETTKTRLKMACGASSVGDALPSDTHWWLRDGLGWPWFLQSPTSRSGQPGNTLAWRLAVSTVATTSSNLYVSATKSQGRF